MSFLGTIIISLVWEGCTLLAKAIKSDCGDVYVLNYSLLLLTFFFLYNNSVVTDCAGKKITSSLVHPQFLAMRPIVNTFLNTFRVYAIFTSAGALKLHTHSVSIPNIFVLFPLQTFPVSSLFNPVNTEWRTTSHPLVYLKTNPPLELQLTYRIYVQSMGRFNGV